MRCLVCHQLVADSGPTFPRSVHLACVDRWQDGIRLAEQRLFAASIPRGDTVKIPRWAPLTMASERETSEA